MIARIHDDGEPKIGSTLSVARLSIHLGLNIARIAIAVISEVIVLHGPQYAPWLDRLERELEELQRKRGEDPLSRARRHLAARAEARP